MKPNTSLQYYCSPQKQQCQYYDNSQVISHILPFTEDDLNENDLKNDLKDTLV